MRSYEEYSVSYDGNLIGYYYIYEDHKEEYGVWRFCSEEVKKEVSKYGLDQDIENSGSIEILSSLIDEKNRVKGRKRIIYDDGHLRLERIPRESGETFYVYRRAAKQGDLDYSPLPHDAPHYEGEKTPEGMREWANWYAFRKMDDGTYEASLDEAWWWGGSHDDGGTMHREIPEEWFELSYDEFLEHVVTLAAAAHYGFTPEILKNRKGLKEFFGFKD